MMKKVISLILVLSICFTLSACGSVNVGNSITLGSYEQDNDLSNGKEPIEWVVLDKKDGKVLVISKYILDCQPFNLVSNDVTWETCTLRLWLNQEFLSTAFTADEQKKIFTTQLSVSNYQTDGLTDGNPTQDQLFLLSQAEIDNYFVTSSLRSRDDQTRTPLTAYARIKTGEDGLDTSSWWSRSVLYLNGRCGATCALTPGAGLRIDATVIGVRPAMWIRIDM